MRTGFWNMDHPGGRSYTTGEPPASVPSPKPIGASALRCRRADVQGLWLPIVVGVHRFGFPRRAGDRSDPLGAQPLAPLLFLGGTMRSILRGASLVLVGSCTAGVPADKLVSTDPGDAHDTAQPCAADGGDVPKDPSPVADPTVEEVTGSAPAAGACSDLYDPDELRTFALDFSDEEWSSIQRDCARTSQAYHPVQLTVGDETVDAMARLKGNWSWSCDKMQFVVSFNEVDPDGRFHGLRKLVIEAPWYDHTVLHERLAFPLFKARGLPWSCVNNVRVDINGSYYGLYANVERIDHEYLERHFEEYGGNLYQGGVELKTNEDVGDTSRQQALVEADTVEQIEALVDLDQAVAEWAMEAMIPAMDNYWAGVEINYYLYDHPSRGFVFLPYDLDISFGDAAYSDGRLIWPGSATADPITHEHGGWGKEALVETVLADPYWCGRFVEELALARSVYDPAAMAAQVDLWDAQIRSSLEDDPNKTFSNSRHTTAIGLLKDFVADRAAFVDDWLARGGHCPVD